MELGGEEPSHGETQAAEARNPPALSLPRATARPCKVFSSHAEEEEREERIYWHGPGWQRGWQRGSHLSSLPRQHPAVGGGGIKDK